MSHFFLLPFVAKALGLCDYYSGTTYYILQSSGAVNSNGDLYVYYFFYSDSTYVYF